MWQVTITNRDTGEEIETVEFASYEEARELAEEIKIRFPSDYVRVTKQ